jgi:hypothetical protein
MAPNQVIPSLLLQLQIVRDNNQTQCTSALSCILLLKTEVQLYVAGQMGKDFRFQQFVTKDLRFS